MAQNTTIDLLIDMARRKLDDAANHLADERVRQRNAESRLDLLNQYLTDYYERRRAVDGAATNVLVLANFRAFLSRLEDAVLQQQVELQNADARLAAARKAWERAAQQHRSIEILQQRRRVESDAVTARAQQKLQDEFAARSTGGLALAS